MLRIQRSLDGDVVHFTLSGSIDVDHLAELRRLIDDEGPRQPLVIDLKQVHFVDSDALQFLAQCVERGIQLENASAYVRESIARECAGGIPGPDGTPKRRSS